MRAFNWQHGVFLGSGMGAETAAAETGEVGIVRLEPVAMLPFCGYNTADYFAHWLSIVKRLKKPPLIFRVNWFRKVQNGKFLWPGHGENVRLLKWILEGVRGTGEAAETALGSFPMLDSIDTEGLSLRPGAMAELTSVDKAGWLKDVTGLEKFYSQFGNRMPAEIWEEHRKLKERPGAVSV